MKATAKYLFDEDFATGAKPTITLVEAERRRADAEIAGLSQGLCRRRDNRRRTTRPSASPRRWRMIADAMERLERALAGIEARLETEAVEVAVAVAAKLAPELIAREPFAEISALATECFRHLVKAPHVVVHIGADIYETRQGQARGNRQRARLRRPAGGAARSGHGAGDCRIEWADGGVARDRAADPCRHR